MEEHIFGYYQIYVLIIMANKYGIFSLRGYLYQIKVFILSVVENIGNNVEITYEGEEDVDISHQSFAKVAFKDKLIQVKSGKINNDILFGVISNWLIEDNEDKIHELIFESGNDTIKDTTFFDKYYNYISDEDRLKKHPKTKHSKCFNKYKNKETIKNAYMKILEKYQSTNLSSDDLEESIIQKLAENYSIHNRAKTENLSYMVVNEIQKQVFERIKNNTNYTINFAIYNKILTDKIRVADFDEYKFDVHKFSNNLEDLVKQADDVFLKQIYAVSTKSDFRILNIKCELEYELFREMLDDDEIEKIKETESDAIATYIITKANDKIKSPYDLYESTIKNDLRSNILLFNQLSKIGCYNYLTTSKIDENNRIKWVIEDE